MIKVSYFSLSILVRFFVVESMSEFNNDRKILLVFLIMSLLIFTFLIADSE